ncbi:MAG: hypothetical protein O2816_10885 [Planctomycetota bacterium]|nr:hypothetical protein [Planctomycetota bacterium]
MNAQTEPSRDELLAMAYVDGELSAEDRDSVEARMPSEPDLARQVSHYQALELLARQMAPPEPADHEWARLEGDLLHSSGSKVGWFLFAAGGLGLAGYGVYGLATAGSLNPVPRACLLCLVAGVGILLGTTLRARLRIMPYDPYRKVQR